MEGDEGYEGFVAPVNVAASPITLKKRQFYEIIRADGAQFSRLQRAMLRLQGERAKGRKRNVVFAKVTAYLGACEQEIILVKLVLGPAPDV